MINTVSNIDHVNSKGAFEEKVRVTLHRYRMLSGGPVAVGFSGGRDSVALLDFLDRLKEEWHFSLIAVHVNHGIRGEEADRDERFCREFCARREIRLFCFRYDVPSLAKQNGESYEECARRVRYAVFGDLLAQGVAERVATAHHARDNLETVLLNLARGSGLRGAAGIPPVRDHLIRPMLFCTPEEISDYITRRKLNYVTDSTNFDESFTRNQIRLRAVGALERANARVYEHVSSFCEDARRDEEFLLEFAKKSKSDQISDLRALHPSIMTRVLSLLYTESIARTPEKKHITALAALISDGKNGDEITLPGGNRAFIDRGRLVFSEGARCRADRKFRIMLQMGENPIDAISCMVLLTEEALTCKQLEDYLFIYKKSIHARINSDKINKAFVRSREDGDAYRCFGMTRKIKKMLQADKLTGREKEQTAVVCDDEGVLWLPGHGVRDGAWDENGLHIYYFLGE